MLHVGSNGRILKFPSPKGSYHPATQSAVEENEVMNTKSTLERLPIKPGILTGRYEESMRELVAEAVKLHPEGSYTLWASSSFYLGWVEGIQELYAESSVWINPREDNDIEGDPVSRPWEGLFQLKHKDEIYHLIGVFFRPPYGISGTYAIVGPSKEKVLALEALCAKKREEFDQKQTRTHIFLPRLHKVERPKQSWDAIVLPEETKKVLQLNIDSFFKGPEAFKKAGVPYKRGILLAGQPGTGKTSIIKALMSQYKDIPFYLFERTDDDVYGTDLRNMYEKASARKPAVVVIEDIDRMIGSGTLPLQDVLNVMDGVTTNDGVMTIATCNSEEKIDAALIERPSRFDLVVTIPMPDDKCRENYIRERSSSLGIVITEEQIKHLLKCTTKLSMSCMQELFTGSVLRSFQTDQITTYDHVLESLKALTRSLKAANKEEKEKKTGFSVAN